MDIRKIAMYLAGKLPPYYGESNLRTFTKALRSFSKEEFTNEEMLFIQQQANNIDEEVYFNVLDDLRELNKGSKEGVRSIFELLQRLEIPSKILPQILKSSNLETERNTLKTITNPQAKGTAFELFLKELFNGIDGFEVITIEQQDDEEIDIVIKNNKNGGFWQNISSALIVGEAKNWTKKTPTSVINTIDGKINNHENFCKMGIVISMKGFTKPSAITVKRKGSKHIIVLITGKDISTLLSSSIDINDWFEQLVIKSFN